MSQQSTPVNAGNSDDPPMEGPLSGLCGAVDELPGPAGSVRCSLALGHGQRWHDDGTVWWYRVQGGHLRFGLSSQPPIGGMHREPIDSTSFADGGFRVVGARPYVPPKPGILATAVEQAEAVLADIPKQREALARVGADDLSSIELVEQYLAALLQLQLADARWKIARGRDVPAR